MREEAEELMPNKVRHALIEVQDKPATTELVEVEITTYDPPIVLHEAVSPKDLGKRLFGFMDLRGRAYGVYHEGRKHMLRFEDDYTTMFLHDLTTSQVEFFKQFSKAFLASNRMGSDPYKYLEPIVYTKDERF